MRSAFDHLVDWAAHDPERVLLSDDSHQLSARAVERVTRFLGARLRAEASPAETRVVASLFASGIDSALVILAAQRSGLAVATIDRSLSVPTLKRLLEVLGPHLLVGMTGDPLLEALGTRSDGTLSLLIRPVDSTLLGEPAVGVQSEPPEAHPFGADLGQAALIVFSSGTTGEPKGVAHSLSGLLESAELLIEIFGITQHDCFAQIASYAFITANDTLTMAIIAGVRIAFYDVETHGLGPLGRFLRSDRPTVLRVQAALGRALAQTISADDAMSLRLVSFGGEALFGSDMAAFRGRFPDATLHVAYGATESRFIAWRFFGPNDPIPSGAVTYNGHDGGYVDDEGQIFGTQRLALGYWNRKELTADRFPTSPDRGRGFRTGDLGQMESSSTLRVLGRVDDQVKVHGHNVLLTLIDAALDAHPDVQQSATVDVIRPGGGRALVAFVVPSAGAVPGAASLRVHLREHLAPFMVPGRFIVLDRLPTTPGGKTDRAALRAGELFTSPVSDVGPRTPMEALVCERISILLGFVEQPHEVQQHTRQSHETHAHDEPTSDVHASDAGFGPSVHDDFFEIGGDSLSALEFLAWVNSAFGIEAPLSLLVEHPTIEALAMELDRRIGLHRGVTDLRIHGERSQSTIGRLAGNAGPAAIVIAGAGDSYAALRPLAVSLREHFRVFGFHGLGMDDDREPERTVAAYVDRAVREIRATVEGPYVLCGHSFGGVIAQAVACALEEAGEHVLLVALLDTPAPVTADSVDPLRRVLRRFRRHRVESSELAQLRVLGVDREGWRRRKGLVYDRQVRALDPYRPRQCRAPILVVVAADDPLNANTPADSSSPPRFAAWNELTAGGCGFVSSPGTHVSIKSDPFAAQAGAIISDRALASSRTTASTQPLADTASVVTVDQGWPEPPG
jgi:acyl-coenzyme A synthetase/AMP-(fatty) acid ligase/thioesterase domain-containing protein